MRVADVMTRRVRTVDQHDSIDRAAGVLRFWQFRHLPVLDALEHVVGIVTPADLLEVARGGGDLADEPVSRAMSKPVVTAREDETIESAMERMLKRDVHAMPVLGPDGRLVGIVADQDLLAVIARPASKRPLDEVVDAVMTRDPVTIEPEATLGDAAEVLLQGGFRHLPVVDGEGQLVGMISERDLRARLGEELADFPSATLEALTESVSESMTPDPVSVAPGTPLADVLETFAAERVGAITVVDGDALVGIVSYVDVLKWLRDAGVAPRSS